MAALLLVARMKGWEDGANADDITICVVFLFILTPWIRDLDPIFRRPTDERFACVLHTFPYRDIYMTLRQKRDYEVWGKNETHYWKPVQKSQEVESKGLRLIFPENNLIFLITACNKQTKIISFCIPK